MFNFLFNHVKRAKVSSLCFKVIFTKPIKGDSNLSCVFIHGVSYEQIDRFIHTENFKKSVMEQYPHIKFDISDYENYGIKEVGFINDILCVGIINVAWFS